MEEIQKLELLVNILHDLIGIIGRIDDVRCVEQLALIEKQQKKIQEHNC
jgi:hypothetical protein